MALVARLVTFVDIADANPSPLGFSARHEAVLADGRRMVLLNDRGWTQSRINFIDWDGPVEVQASSPWEGVTREQIEETARTVVGPECAYRDFTQAEIDEGHWSYLSAALEQQGLDVDASDLRALPHDVELSDRLLARLGEPPN